LYTKGGKLNYCYNWVGQEQYKLTAEKPLPAGKVTVKFTFDYDGGGLGKGGKGMLYVNGEKVAEGRIEHTASVIFSPDETADVGVDEATNVTNDYREIDNKFTGKIRRVTVELK
jgi:arylsulfatase